MLWFSQIKGIELSHMAEKGYEMQIDLIINDLSYWAMLILQLQVETVRKLRVLHFSFN